MQQKIAGYSIHMLVLVYMLACVIVYMICPYKYKIYGFKKSASKNSQ